jgi:hypothetical protein
LDLFTQLTNFKQFRKMPKRSIVNKYVSSSHSVNKDVKNFVKGLRWVHVGQHTSRPSTSSTATGSAKKTQWKAWDFMGRLVKEDELYVNEIQVVN